MDTPTILGRSQDDRAKVYWSPVKDALEYEVRVGEDGEVVKTGKTWIVLGTKRETMNPAHSSITQPDVNQVQIRALGKEGSSAWSPVVTSTPKPTPPPTPTPPPPSDPPKDGN